MILMDSDIAIDLLRKYAPAIDWFMSLPRSEHLVVSGFSALELVAGVQNASEQRRVEKWLAQVRVAWPTQEGCSRALGLFAQYHLSHGAGLLDVFVAQTAIELGAPLHTFNVKHYRFIPGLALVQPYTRRPRPTAC
jgi:predicted nucleic acid-binding protein